MGQEFSTMCAGGGKPAERTGASVVRTKLERAAKTGVLQLASQKLKKLPQFDAAVTAAVHSLDLSHNALGPCLEDLRPADWSKLKALKLQAVAGLEYRLEAVPSLEPCNGTLRSLDVSENPKLTAAAVDAALGASQPKLFTLVLRDNPRLGAVPALVFSPGLAALQTLDLRRCGIVVLPPPPDASAPALVELLLDGNALSDVPAALAAAAPNLKRLALEANRLAALPPQLLRHRKLEHIDLKANRISKKQFLELPGSDEFMARREATRKKEGSNMSDFSVCGLG